MTRNPLLIRMIRLPDNSEESEYATITDEERSDPPERIDDLANVPDFIRKYTNKLSGEKTNVTKKEITLTIHRKNIYDLTLIGRRHKRFNG